MKLFFFTFSALFIYSSGLPHQRDSHLEPDLTKNFAGNPEIDPKYWYDKATNELNKRNEISSGKKAKNIIFFLGDGMSIPTLTGARIFLAQKKKQLLSESEGLSFENFSVSGLSRTYCVDGSVADSACSATAFFGGAKANMGTIGVSGRVARGNLTASLDPKNQIQSFASLAQKNGKATGFVTTNRVTHSMPAATYSYIADRSWECDADMEASKVNSTAFLDIAEQLFYHPPGINFNVIMGGGRGKLIPTNEVGPDKTPGSRLDKVNLISKWEEYRKSKNEKFKYLTNRKDLANMTEVPDYLLGLFANSNMNGTSDDPIQPTLEEMTEKALKVLQKTGSSKGYFLFVESGRIEAAHHNNQAKIALEETIEFSKAVAKAVKMTNASDTLIVVTADHSHTMSISGYFSREASIFGFGGKGKDNWVYTALSYANGPGYKPRKDLSSDKTEEFKYAFPAGVPLDGETHAGDDVAVFARGPNAQMFSGSYEQSYIGHAMAYIADMRPKY